ncbi:MAG: hypothetical protein CL844_09275 [Crocinitomicaceae bacterium]|nr:hypothetical protein [Crocinitomicaceae bacterium]
MIRIKFLFLLMLFLSNKESYTQELYNSCFSALEICPDNTYSINNYNANITSCPGCEDDFLFCFTAENTIWLKFTTNQIGGDVLVNFNNLSFNVSPNQDTEIQAVIIEATTPCNSASYTEVSNCVSDGSAPFNLNAIGLAPNTTYYIVINGDKNGAGISIPAECSFNLTVSGAGIERPTPVINITASDTSICLNDVVLFEAILQDCPNSSSYKWYINNVLIAETNTAFFSTSDISDGDVVTVENSCFTNCVEIISSDSPIISVYSFYLDAGDDVTVPIGTAVNLNGMTSAPNYSWEPSLLFTNPTELSTVIFPEQTTIVTLIAIENNCVLTDNITITIIEDISIPNMFSPNNDGINDSWIIKGIEKYPNNTIVIYDRWGQEVFKTNSYNSEKAWNGKIKNNIVTEGVFYFVLELNNEENKQYKGSITVIR